jgi:stress-induced-phosphoprotein 1
MRQGYSRVAAAYHALGEFEKAKEAYETGLKHEPNNEAMKKGLLETQSALCTSPFCLYF